MHFRKFPTDRMLRNLQIRGPLDPGGKLHTAPLSGPAIIDTQVPDWKL